MEDNKPNNPYVNPIQENTLTNYGGMTLRDHFAGLAMQGLMSMEDKGEYNTIDDAWSKISEYSYKISDAMLKQRDL